MKCIIHYDGYDRDKYSEIKPISANAKKRIEEAKLEREKYSDTRYHKQCSLIPSEIDETQHGVRLQPCYAVFTHILSKTKRDTSEVPRTTRSSIAATPLSPLATIREESSNDILLIECIDTSKCLICKKRTLQE